MRLDKAILDALEREISDAHARLALKKSGTMEYDQLAKTVSDLECQLERYIGQAEPQAPMQAFVPSPRP